MAMPQPITGLVLVVGVGTAAAGLVGVGGPPPEAIDGWNRYVQAVERRFDRETSGSAGPFLSQEYAPDWASRRTDLIGGRERVDRVEELDAAGRALTVDDGRVHHWRGAVLLPGVRLQDVVTRFQTEAPRKQPGVLEARVLSREPDAIRLFLKVERSQVITVVYETEHEVVFRAHGPTRFTSVATAVRINQVVDAGEPGERLAAPDEDYGFLWRWRAYWRYREVPAGVIAECESISLSRTVPFLVRYLVEPLIRRTAEGSMGDALDALRNQYVSGATSGTT